MRSLFILAVLCCSVISVKAQTIVSEAVQYNDHGISLEGYISYDPSVKGKGPLVIVVHEWKGVNDYIKKRCKQLASLGYVAFAVDIYGKGIRPSTSAEAAKEAGKYKSDRKLMRQRMNAGLAHAKSLGIADTTRIAVIGYCFGGTAALELGRSGADVDGIVSFHGGLDNPNPVDVTAIRGKVLICHGAIDPNVPEKDILTFQKEMNDAKIDYQFISYSNAVHAFTNPDSGNDISKGAAYNKDADRRSWDHMMVFFSEVFRK